MCACVPTQARGSVRLSCAPLGQMQQNGISLDNEGPGQVLWRCSGVLVNLSPESGEAHSVSSRREEVMQQENVGVSGSRAFKFSPRPAT